LTPGRDDYGMRILAIFALLAAQGAGRKQTVGSVQGIVFDDNGEPLPNAIVYGLPGQEMSHQIRRTTDLDGRFKPDGIPPGWVYVDAYKESAGYPYNFFSFFLTDGKTPVKVDVTADKTTEGIILNLGQGRLGLVFK
jgi:hypothetical protein